MKKLLILMMLTVALKESRGQVDPHFSQYYVYPSWLNPALTGGFDGDYKVSAIYRSQWASLNNGFKTIGVNAEMTTNKDLNIGLNVFSQSTGTGYTYTDGYASVSYTGLKFGNGGSNVIALGLQAGVIDMRFNPSKFTVGEQWNTNTGFTGGNNSDLGNMTAKSATSFDAGAGALYYNNNPSLKFSPYVGFSASHLTQPASDFYKGADNARMPIRYTVHGGLAINASPGLTVTPNFLYLSQGNAHETMVSAHAQIKAGNELDLLAGLNYRFNDAVVPVVGLDYKNFLIGLSYDVNTSDLGKTVSNVNSFEISLTYIFKKVRVLEEKRFTCPRL